MTAHNTNNPGRRGGFLAQAVSYDEAGEPQYTPAQFVHLSRAVEPMEEHIPPEVVRLHDESVKKYPNLNLSKAEYVIGAVQRHPIGALKVWLIGLVLILAFMAVYLLTFTGANASSDLQQFAGIAVLILALVILLTVGGVLAATYVYFENRFYLTNESVIQEIRSSLFSENEQTVSLANIEDASYAQGGILPIMFNYGTIRLSTEGDETTYRFSYVANPKHHIAILNNAVESFKNGRPVGMPDDDD